MQSALFVLLALVIQLVHTSSDDPLVDTSEVLRKLLTKEKLCDKQIKNFKPEKTRALKSPICPNTAILKKCDCTSDNRKVVVTDVKEKVDKGLCKCKFTNEGKKKKENVKIKACVVCETLEDECKNNDECTTYEKPICDRQAVPRICIQCKRDSQCSTGETCIDNVCIS